MKKLFLMALLLIGGMTVAACGEAGDTYLEVNPYEGVDWEAHEQVLANLHTHTDYDDGHGDAYPHEAVDLYEEMGYGALAITDHDLVTYNEWRFSELDDRYEDRDPEELGMIAIPGNEYSREHHFNGLFTTYCTQDVYYDTEREAMDNILAEDEDALMFLAHPGRYWELDEDYDPEDEYSPQWYLDFYDEYAIDELAGIEVFNTQDRYPDDRHLWDRLLQDAMPNRPIWAFANDDYHGGDLSEVHWSMSFHLMEDTMDEDEFRQTMVDGAFYAAYTRNNEASPPQIDEIIVDEDDRSIEIVVDGDYDEIRWKSGVSEETGRSRVVARGEVFEYAEFEGNYVRAEIVYEEGMRKHAEVLTQPFGFMQED